MTRPGIRGKTRGPVRQYAITGWELATGVARSAAPLRRKALAALAGYGGHPSQDARKNTAKPSGAASEASDWRTGVARSAAPLRRKALAALAGYGGHPSQDARKNAAKPSGAASEASDWRTGVARSAAPLRRKALAALAGYGGHPSQDARKNTAKPSGAASEASDWRTGVARSAAPLRRKALAALAGYGGILRRTLARTRRSHPEPRAKRAIGEGWRRGWDSNSVRVFRICNLQKPRCRHRRRCQGCRRALHAIARTAERTRSREDNPEGQRRHVRSLVTPRRRHSRRRPFAVS